jgi:hypothetical protein
VCLPSSRNEHVGDVSSRVCTVRGWLDCSLLGIENILCLQRTLTSRKDMLAASSTFKCCVCIEAKLSVLCTFLYLLTYLLTPWSRVLLEKLTGFQLVKKFAALYGTRKFITAKSNYKVICIYIYI